MKVIITFTFCCDNQWKSKFMDLEKPGKLGNFFSYFVANLCMCTCELHIVLHVVCSSLISTLDTCSLT